MTEESPIPFDLESWIPETDAEPYAQHPLWTSANASEVLPGIIPPLAARLGAQVVDRGFIGACRALGILRRLRLDKRRDLHSISYFYGRAHLNLSLFRLAGDLLPGSSAEDIDQQYVGHARDPNAPPRKFPWRLRLFRAYVFLRVLAVLIRQPRRMHRMEGKVVQYLQREKEQDPAVYSDEELVAKTRENVELLGQVLELHFMNSALASSGLGSLEKSLRSALGDCYDPELVPNLCTGLGDVESAKPSYELWRLSRLAAEVPELRSLFTTMLPPEIDYHLNRLSSPAGQEFRVRLGEFLKAYGYRGMREADLSTPCWSEDPTFVYSAISNYLTSQVPDDPLGTEERQARIRQETERRVRSQLTLLRWPTYRQSLALARRYIAFREKSKSQWVRLLERCRPLVRELGHRLSQRSLIGAPEDVYFLFLGEAYRLLQDGGDPREVLQRIQRRSQEHKAFHHLTLPEWFEGRPTPRLAETPEEAVPHGMRVLKGTPVSPGRVTGRARVIHSVQGAARIDAGEILVAPFTDAAWTPLFFSARAAVVDVGGLLSHASIVAREYGLPAVVNVKVGTTVIKDGQMITVDGTKGEIHLLE